jgi:hypothetical protein
MFGQSFDRKFCSFPRLINTLAMLLVASAPGLAQAERSAPDLAYLQASLSTAAPELNPQALQRALAAMTCAINHGEEPASRLAVIDFSLPSSEQRLWLFDLDTEALILRELVAHGQGSGDNYAKTFSNIEGSHQSSIGLFRTQESYFGQHGYSLRLDGLEAGINDQARRRAIVIHGADYVDASWIARQGRIGRSQGCPAVPQHAIKTVVDHLQGGQFLFAYYPDEQWIQTSAYLNCAGVSTQNLLASGNTSTNADSL